MEAALDDALAAAYLELLGVDAAPGAVDAAKLIELQCAHLRSVPYENVDIVRGHPPGIAPIDCARRIVAGRGGYCYHLNGGFSALLDWLRVDLSKHLAGVQGRAAAEPPGANGNHLALTARVGDEEWLVDAGLGDGPAEPIPLAHGHHEQHGFSYTLGPSPLAPGGFRFHHDPRGSWLLFDVAPGSAKTAEFADMHTKLSTSPDSGFVRTLAVMRRTRSRVEILRGCIFTDRDGDELREHEVGTPDDWWGIVIDGFGLSYGDLAPGERSRLWRRIRSTHEAWDAAGRP